MSVMTNDVGVETMIRGQHGTMKFEDGAEWGQKGKVVIHEQGAWAPEFRKNNADLGEDRREG